MQLISIDLGSYSIKFLVFRLEKNGVVYDYAREVVLDSDEYNVVAGNIEQDLQLKIVREFLAEFEGDARLIVNAPPEMVTTRFLELPVGNRKKAQLMIPFQLEEDIPFSLGNSHIASSIKTGKGFSKALVNIAPKDEFTPFYDRLLENKIHPKVLTSQDSVYQNFIRQNSEILPQSFCILDFGHTTTKAYFYFEDELVAIHKSYIAGKTLNEVISENYKIDFEEAALYKHQNCFFLTRDQYDQVNENQKAFALLMDKALAPLVHEFKRWEIGSRVIHGVGVSEVFITGGTSNIKNIENFLTEQFETKTSFLETFGEKVNAKAVDEDPKLRRKFAYANIQAQSYQNKSGIVNFLYGEYSIQGQSDLPLQSFAFIGVRAALVTLLLVFSFALERVFIHRDMDALDRSLSSISQNPALEMTARQRRIMRTDPATVQRELGRKQKAIEQEISVLQASANTNALSALKTIAGIATGLEIEITQFSAVSGGEYNVVFKTETLEELNQLDRLLNSAGLNSAFTDRDENNLLLTLSAMEN